MRKFSDYEVVEEQKFDQEGLNSKLEETKDLAIKIFCDKISKNPKFSSNERLNNEISNKLTERLANVTIQVKEMYDEGNKMGEYYHQTNSIRINSTFVKSLGEGWLQSNALQEVIYHEIRHAMYEELEEYLTSEEFTGFNDPDNINLIRNLRYEMKKMLSSEYKLSNGWTKDLVKDKEKLKALVGYRKDLSSIQNDYVSKNASLKNLEVIFKVLHEYFLSSYLGYEEYQKLSNLPIIDGKLQLPENGINDLEDKIYQGFDKLVKEYGEDIKIDAAQKALLQKYFIDNLDQILIEKKVGDLLYSIDVATQLYRSSVNSEVYYIFDDESYTEAYSRFITHEMVYLREGVDYTNEFKLRKFIVDQISIVESGGTSVFATLTKDSYDLKIFKILVQEDETGFDLIRDYMKLLQGLVNHEDSTKRIINEGSVTIVG